jgi:hypothetical protein
VKPPIIRLDTLDAILARCVEEGECWMWAQGLNGAGHPVARHAGTSILVRRRAYELHHGRVPDGRSHGLRMTCRNTRCVNPSHIEAVTRSRLIREAKPRAAEHYMTFVRARVAQGTTKLGFAAARAIRADLRSCIVVAAEYGVSPSLVTQIRRGEVWRDALPNSSVFHFRPKATGAGRSSSLDRKAA